MKTRKQKIMTNEGMKRKSDKNDLTKMIKKSTEQKIEEIRK